VRFKSSRRKGSYIWAVVGGCLAVYVILAAAFNWLIAPIVVAKNDGGEAYNPPAVTTALHSGAPLVAPDASSKPPPPVLLQPPDSARNRGESEPPLSQSPPAAELQPVTPPQPVAKPPKRASKPAARRSACIPSYDSSGAQTGAC
jgi:hypothetical protein